VYYFVEIFATLFTEKYYCFISMLFSIGLETSVVATLKYVICNNQMLHCMQMRHGIDTVICHFYGCCQNG